MSEAILMQAIGRVRRLGQRRIVKIYDYSVKKTFNSRQINNNLAKVIPNMVAQLNNSLFKLSFNEDRKEIDLGSWFKNQDRSLSRVPPQFLDWFDADELLTGDALIFALMNVLKEGSLTTVRQDCDLVVQMREEGDCA
jgi:hypothetical protein